MADFPVSKPDSNPPVPVLYAKPLPLDPDHDVLCDRCAQPMFRMRAVYWCVNCGYKTDCCGH